MSRSHTPDPSTMRDGQPSLTSVPLNLTFATTNPNRSSVPPPRRHPARPYLKDAQPSGSENAAIAGTPSLEPEREIAPVSYTPPASPTYPPPASATYQPPVPAKKAPTLTSPDFRPVWARAATPVPDQFSVPVTLGVPISAPASAPVPEITEWVSVELSNVAPYIERHVIEAILKDFDVSNDFRFPKGLRFSYPFRVIIKVAGQFEANRLVKELHMKSVGGRKIFARVINRIGQEDMEVQIQDLADELKNGIISTYFQHPLAYV